MTSDQLLTKNSVIKGLVVLIMLVVAVGVGLNISSRLAIGVTAIAGFFVLWQKPLWGLVAVLVASLTVPFTVGTGTQTSLHAAILLIPALVVIWLADLLRQKAVCLVSSPANLPLIAFIMSATISLIAGSLPWNYFAAQAPWRAQLGGWLIFILSASVFLLVGNQVKDIRWLKILTWFFLAFGAVIMFGRLVPLAAPLTSQLSVEGSQGGLFWVWLVALAGGQLFFNRRLKPAGMIALLAIILATLGVGWFIGRSWTSGWLPGLVTVLIILWLRLWRLGLVVTLAASAYLLAIEPNILATVITGDQYSIDTRQAAWRILIEQVLPANPILGLGPANYYFYTSLYSIMGYHVRFNSHNQYIDILAQTGIVGLSVFIWLMATIGRVGWGLREQCGDGFARGYVYGCLAGLAGTLVAGILGDWFLPFVYNIGLAGFRASMLGWLFLGGLVALEAMAQDKTL